MGKLFGIDIAGVVASSIAGAGNVRPGVLKRIVPGSRTTGSLAAGTNPVTTEFPFRGFKVVTSRREKGQVGAGTMSIVSILSASLSVVPEVNDLVTMDGDTYTLLELLELDPAEAIYEFHAE